MHYCIWLFKYYTRLILAATRYQRQLGIIKYAKVLLLKRKAKRHYLRYKSISNGYSCGASMLHYFSTDANQEYAKFKSTMAKLKTLDPNCP